MPISGFGPVCWGSQLLIQECTQPRFQVWAPRPLIEVLAHPGALGLGTQAAKPLTWVHTDPHLWACVPGEAGPLIRLRVHPGFQLWAPSLLIELCTHLGFRCVLGLLILRSQSRV